MTEKNQLMEALTNTIRSESNNNPPPQSCVINKVYDDKVHVDIQLTNGNSMSYIKTIGKPSEDEEGIVVFINGETNNPMVIPQSLDVYSKFGLEEKDADKFNYAVISRVTGEVTNIEFWILANADYDYENQRFVKLNPKSNSFGIQIQAEGSYPGEQELGYIDNTSIGVWRHPKVSSIYRDTTLYDYTDLDEKGFIGCKRLSDEAWLEFGVSAGWNNNFMMDAFGGMTIGGAGFEIDGNGIFPYTRLTHSLCTINGTKFALFGLLDNAYHPTLSSWQCDSNSTYSWFVGLLTPVNDSNVKDNTATSFVVMYNDTSPSSEVHSLNDTNWHIVFRVNTGGVVQ